MTTGLSKNKTRIDAVDALRGFALAGVCLVHMMEQYLAAPPPEGMSQVSLAGLTDEILAGLNQLFFVGKFYALFSLLFGLSFYLQFLRAQQNRGAFTGRFARRLIVLLAFGVLHHLFYRGDILMLYAIIGLLLLPLNRLSSRWLLLLALFVLTGGGRFLSFAVFGSEPIFGSPGLNADAPEIAQYFEVLKNGSLPAVFAQNALGGMQAKFDYQFGVFGRGYSTFGLFLVGLCLGRCGFFETLQHSRALLKTTAKWASAIGFLGALAASLTFSQVEMPPSFNTWLEMLALTAVDLFNLALATLIACGFLALGYAREWRGCAAWFRPYGRMALSNYLLQALVGTFIFYGWGLGQIAQWRNLYCALAGIALIGTQVLLSHYWLTVFQYGPVEWLWRVLTTGAMVPIRRSA